MSISYEVYPKVVRAIELISQGRTRTRACDTAGVSIPTFEEYVENDMSLQKLLIDAERRGYDALADSLLTIHENDARNVISETNPQMAKVLSDNIKWLLDKRDRKRFGQQVEVKHELSMDQAIINALDAAKRRKQSGQVIDLEPNDFTSSTAPALIDHVVHEVVHDVVLDDDEIMRELLGC